MKRRDLTQVDIERLLLGTADLTDDVAAALGPVIAQIRTQYTSTTLPPVGAELAQFVNLNLVVNTNDLLAEAAALSQLAATPAATRIHTQQVRASIRHRRNKARIAVGTFTGTLTAKILLGGAFAFAAASGAQALGIVDIPLLPNFGQHHHVDNTPPDTVDDPPTTTDQQINTQTDTNGTADDDQTSTTGAGTGETDDHQTGTGTGTPESDNSQTGTTETDDSQTGTTETTETTETDYEQTGITDSP